MASIMKRGDSYSVRYKYKDHSGKPCEGWESFKTKKEAQERKITVEKELLDGTFLVPNTMTVEDNVKVGLHNQAVYGMWTGILRLPSFREKEHEMDRRAMKLLKIFDLDAEANYKASQLPYGKQRKLEIARALATATKLLLLDEPAAGMNPNETQELMDTIRFVREHFDMTVLLIEHDMKLVGGICEELTVLNFGQVLIQGETSAVLKDPTVITAYLGE